MKIAYIVRSYNKRGGISGYVAELAARMSKNDEVHVFASSIEDDSGAIKQHIIPAISSEYLKKIKKYSWNVALEVQSFMMASRKLVEKDKYDIVHSQGDYKGQCDVYTAHSCHKAWLAVARAEKSGILEYFKKSTLNPLHYIILRAERYGIWRSKKVIAVSESVKKEIERCYPGSADKTVTIPNGIDTKRFNPANRLAFRKAIRDRHSLKDSDILSVFPAHEFKRKGLRQVIDAVAATGSDNLYLIVIGRDSPSDYIKQARSKGISKQIIFSGECSDIEQYYAAADMMVFPTLYEPFGLVITEAMASGLPVIVTSTAGAAELITDGSDGLLLKDRNSIAEITEKMKYLIGNKDGAAQIGENARKTAQKYSWEIITQKTRNLYEVIIEEKRHIIYTK